MNLPTTQLFMARDGRTLDVLIGGDAGNWAWPHIADCR